ncbi:lysophospholipid acyltransferase family protein [Thauera sinica]|uniref:Lysophospholipid acyltransferase family protein n=1 Tax=Thauera sinica TaxID=2665146 RepID=A0ABW1AQJ0_9RHOO|nr:lysophospholipid acyltransferase family protein [Thauera sp. K11]ATE62256.1 lipid A biosynthesis acyltransferase [Thauera sp. K11]
MIVQSLFRLLARLPLSWLHRLGGWAGWITYAASPTYRRRLRQNLFNALGREDTRLLRAAIAETGRQFIEIAWVWLRPVDAVMEKLRVEGWELVEAAHREGAGLLFVTPHLGCFEINAQYIATREPITVLYRPPRKSVLAPLMEAGRSRPQLRAAPADLSGVRQLVKTLRNRGAVGMLPDQVPGAGEGVWAPFFGRPAWTMTLAARLAEVKGVRTIYCWVERLPRGEGFVMRLYPPTLPLEGDLEARCATINREVERLIMLRPEQYLWGYNRYKKPRSPRTGDSGGAADGAGGDGQ